MSQKKDIMNIIRQLEDQGWTVTKSRRNGHWQAKSPDGQGMAYFPATPSDWRSVANTRARLRMLGAEIK